MTKVLYEEKFNLLLNYVRQLESELVAPSRITIKGKEKEYNIEVYRGDFGLYLIQVYSEEGIYLGTLSSEGATQQIEYTNIIDDLLSGYMGDAYSYFQ